MNLDFDPVEFIRAQTSQASAAFIPEIRLHLAAEITPLWQLTEEKLNESRLPPPFWAFAWPGGQGVARYILDHPEVARGKRVIDFATGGGIVAIAAMKAGAVSALAVDIDPLALAATRLNAALNGVAVEIAEASDVDMSKAPKRVDLILAGDFCYEQAMSARILRWLWICVAGGVRVIMADPGRAYVPPSGLTELACYTVPTLRDLEDHDRRTVRVWEVGLPEEGA
jgi:predicted nicotinamide N-methyase